MKKHIKYSIVLLSLLMSMFLVLSFSALCIEPSSIEVIKGNYTSGNLDSIITEYDDNYYAVSETTKTPAIDIRINFSNVINTFNSATIRAWYEGTKVHEAHLELWNYTSGSWDSYIIFYDSSRFLEEIRIIPNYQHYISGELVQSRIYIDFNGNINHNFLVEYIALNEFNDIASRGEFIAAALVASLILVPLLILIIFAARRKW